MSQTADTQLLLYHLTVKSLLPSTKFLDGTVRHCVVRRTTAQANSDATKRNKLYWQKFDS